MTLVAHPFGISDPASPSETRKRFLLWRNIPRSAPNGVSGRLKGLKDRGKKGHLGYLPVCPSGIGPTIRKNASDDQGRPTGRPIPINGNGPAQDLPFHCDFPGCDRTFGSKIGLGVHRRSKHPEFADQLVNVAVGRDRWTEEEERMMARREAEMQIGGERYINMALAVEFRGRSLDSIKSHRRGVAYKRLFVTMLEEVQQERRSPSPSPPPRPRSGRRSLLHDSPPDETDEGGLVQFFLTLDRPTAEKTAYNIHELFAICEGAPRRDKQQTLTRTALYLQQLLPTPPPSHLHIRAPQLQVPTTKRKEQRRDYAKSHILWKKDRARCINNILDGTADTI